MKYVIVRPFQAVVGQITATRRDVKSSLFSGKNWKYCRVVAVSVNNSWGINSKVVVVLEFEGLGWSKRLKAGKAFRLTAFFRLSANLKYKHCTPLGRANLPISSFIT